MMMIIIIIFFIIITIKTCINFITYSSGTVTDINNNHHHQLYLSNCTICHIINTEEAEQIPVTTTRNV